MPAASSSASSTVRLPSYSRQASVTVARWIFDRSICLNIVETSLFVNRYTFNAYRLTIFQYFRHAEEAVSLVRRVGQRPLLCERRLHCVHTGGGAGQRPLLCERRLHWVLAKHVLSRQNGRGRLHAFGVHLLELLHIRQYRAELAGEHRLLVLADLQPRQLSHVLDPFLPDLHKSQPLINSCHCERPRGSAAIPSHRRTRQRWLRP